MDKNAVARDNHAFFYVMVGAAMCQRNCRDAVLDSLDTPSLYNIENGYISFDTTSIKKNCSHFGFTDEIHHDNLLSKVASQIPRRIMGEMNDEVIIESGPWKFTFKITKYERGSNHDYETVENPLLLPKGEHLNRFVELKITLVE